MTIITDFDRLAAHARDDYLIATRAHDTLDELAGSGFAHHEDIGAARDAIEHLRRSILASAGLALVDHAATRAHADTNHDPTTTT